MLMHIAYGGTVVSHESTAPLTQILTELHKSLQQKSYYAALMTALCLPDFCAALRSPNGETTKQKYKAWLRANTAYKSQDDIDLIYGARCSVLHRASGLQDPHRLVFAESLPNGDRRLTVDKTHYFELQAFVSDMAGWTWKWLEGVWPDPARAAPTPLPNPVVDANMHKLLWWHGDGAWPNLNGPILTGTVIC